MVRNKFEKMLRKGCLSGLDLKLAYKNNLISNIFSIYPTFLIQVLKYFYY